MRDTAPDKDVERFLCASPPPVTREEVLWAGRMKLRLDTIITSCLPPDRLVTSARCIVVRGNEVLVVTDRDGAMHILPGGRREPGETLVETALREAREETGVEITRPRQIGVLLYEHLTPRPKNYAYPYPHFMQVVFVARAPFDAEVVCDDEWAASAGFMKVAAAREAVRVAQRALLSAALQTMAVKQQRTP